MTDVTQQLADALRAVAEYTPSVSRQTADRLWRGPTTASGHAPVGDLDQDRALCDLIGFDDLRKVARKALTAFEASRAAIVSAIRERDALKEEVERLEKERDYAVRWGNTSLDSVKTVMWRYEDALSQIANHATGGVGVNPESFVQIARAALGGGG